MTTRLGQTTFTDYIDSYSTISYRTDINQLNPEVTSGNYLHNRTETKRQEENNVTRKMCLVYKNRDKKSNFINIRFILSLKNIWKHVNK